MTRILFALLAAPCVAALAAPAAAEPAPAPAPLTMAEVGAAADALWARMDRNRDGRIDAADRDLRLLQRFDAWDANHDGMISKDEFLAHMHARAEGRHEHGDDGDHGDAHGAHGMAMLIVMPALHAAHMANPGPLTRTAFDAAVKARFERLDRNHDGTISADEWYAARAMARDSWQGGWHDRHAMRDDR